MRYPTRGELCELSPIERLRLIEETFVGDPESLPLSEEDEQIIVTSWFTFFASRNTLRRYLRSSSKSACW
jgi:hypothetical protein